MKVRFPLLALALLTGCPSPPEPNPPPTPAPSNTDDHPDTSNTSDTVDPPPAPSSAAPDPTGFGLALYRRAIKGNENLALSPVSLQMALAMAYGGATGETAAEMEAHLGFSTGMHEAMGAAMKRYTTPESPKDPVYELAVANRLFTDRKLTVKPSFLSLTKERYQAEAQALDFRTEPEAARGTINAWVKTQTREKIPELLPAGSVDADTRMVLTNAVYFKGRWAHAFEKEQTKPGAFTLAGGKKTQVPMMHQEAQFRYAEADGAQILEMGYRGGSWAMVFALPAAADGLSALEAKLTEKSLAGWREAMDFTAVQVALPRFELKPEGPLALGNALKDMGVKLAFDGGRADFSGIAPPSADGRLALSEVFHRAYVKVNEQGTEAAAATGLVMKTTSLPIKVPNPKVFTADRPFLFFLVDTSSGAPMFMGRVNNPT